MDFDWRIVAVETETKRPPKQLVYLPALVLLALVAVSQRRRSGPCDQFVPRR